MKKNVLKLLFINLLIGAADVLCFSRSGLNLSLNSPDALTKSAGYTVLLMSVFLFFYGNVRILFRKEAAPRLVLTDDTEGMSLDDYEAELKSLSELLPFAAEDLHKAIRQSDEFQRKRIALSRIITFNNNRALEMLTATCDETQEYLKENMRRLVKRALVIDSEDGAVYEQRFRGELLTLLQKNGEALNQFDTLLSEVSRMGDRVDMQNTDLLSSIEALRMLRGADAGRIELSITQDKYSGSEAQ